MPTCDSIFPLPFYRSDPFPFNQKQIDYIRTYRQKTYQNVGGNYVTNSCYVLNDKKLKYMKKFIAQQLDLFGTQVLKLTPQQKLYVTQSWFNFNPKGSHHHMHDHPNSLVSGTFYIEGERNTNCIIDREYSNAVFPFIAIDVTESNLFNKQSHTISNDLHTLCLFPSRLRHSVEVNHNDVERITLAFNCYLKGTLGVQKYRTELKI